MTRVLAAKKPEYLSLRRVSMLKLRPRSFMVPAGAAIALILSGCGESKVTQCNRLAEVVNQTQSFMQEFEAEIQSFSNNAAAVQKHNRHQSRRDSIH